MDSFKQGCGDQDQWPQVWEQMQRCAERKETLGFRGEESGIQVSLRHL